MRIALVQQHAGPDVEANLRRALAAMGRAAEAGADLVAFAELAVLPFFPQRRGDPAADPLAEAVPGPTSDRIADRARELGLVTVFNLYERDEAGRTFDASPVFDADGSLLGVTRMVHVAQFDGFWEKDYYAPGDRGAPVYRTRAGSIGVAICYDRHFPEYMRALALGGADLVVIPQAGAAGEWPEGMFEAEVRAAAFQNGYWAALCNRVGVEPEVEFAGGSFACDPEGRVVARAAAGEDDLLLVDVNPGRCADAPARRLFLPDRRPELYRRWLE